ncbi:MAG: trans-sulfuration enzyme family protein [Acidimicrobiales bacterium]
MDDLDPSTWLIYGGRPMGTGEPLNAPPVLASNFRLPGERYYSRSEGTPTQNGFEELMGGLEGGRSLAFSSGMAAVACLFHGLPVGSTVAIPEDPYHAVNGLAVEGEAQGRWEVRRLDLADTRAWIDAVGEVDLAWLESPANPLMTVADLPAICGAPKKNGTIVAVDSTFATPLVQRPLEFGADVVMQSATKFIGGHSDLLAGVLTTRTEELYDDLYHRRLRNGGTIGAMEAFLATRGARTLALRLEKSMANAGILAERLEAHPQVATVRYPGLPSHETHAHAASFMKGFGAMMSFDVTGPGERASAFVEAARLVNNATSLGGIESTMERRALIPGQESMPQTLVRFSVGCEHVDDLWRDLEQALDATAS